LLKLFPERDWEIVYVNYTNVAVFPLVWMIRKWRALRLRMGFPGSGVRSEDEQPAPWLNHLLRRLFVRMARSRVNFPFGVSLLLVARRR
jgi:hypothetical protein